MTDKEKKRFEGILQDHERARLTKEKEKVKAVVRVHCSSILALMATTISIPSN
jgi:hypothetical protein